MWYANDLSLSASGDRVPEQSRICQECQGKSLHPSHHLIVCRFLFLFPFFFFHFSVASSCSLSASLRNLLMPKQECITTLITLPWKLSERKCILSSLLFLFLKMSHITLAVRIVPYGLLPTVCAGPFFESRGWGFVQKSAVGIVRKEWIGFRV